jgi:hypothetical protein
LMVSIPSFCYPLSSKNTLLIVVSAWNSWQLINHLKFTPVYIAVIVSVHLSVFIAKL